MPTPQKIASSIDLSAGIVQAKPAQQGKIDLSAGLVSQPQPSLDLSAGLVQQNDASQDSAFAKAVAVRMQKYGEPQDVAERHVRGELPANVLNPPQEPVPLPHVTPRPGETFAQTMQRGVEMGRNVTPQQIEQARQGAIERVPTVLGIVAGPLASEIAPEIEGAGLLPKVVNAGSRILSQGAFGAGADVAGHLMGGERPDLKSALETGASFAAGQALLGELPAALLPADASAASSVRPVTEGQTGGPSGGLAEEAQAATPAGSATQPRAASEPVSHSHLEGEMQIGSPEKAPDVLAEPAQEQLAQNADVLRQIADPNRIQSAGDVGKILNEASAELQKNPEARPVLGFEDQQHLADSLGMSVNDLLASKADQPFKAEELVAAKALSDASLTKTLNAARLADDPAYEKEFFENLARHQAIQDQIKARLGETGRTLSAARNEPAMALRQKALDYLRDMPAETRLDLIKKVAAIDPNDTAAMNRFLSEVRPSSTVDKLYEAWMNGILTGGAIPKKLVGDATMLISTPLGKVVGSDTGGALRMVQGYFSGLGDAMDRFASTFRNEISRAHSEFESPRAAIKGPLGRIVRVPTRTLAAITDFFHALNYSGYINEQAYRQAAAEGLTGEAERIRAAELFANPTAEMRKGAFDYATQQTFQKSSVVSHALSEIREKPGLRWLVPFVKTPLAIARENVKFSPAGAIKASVDAYRGKFNPVDAFKASLGTGAFIWALSMAKDGKLSGSGPSNYQDRLRLEAQGWQPDSIKIGNHWLKYRYWEPIGPMLGAAADLVQWTRENPGADSGDKAMAGVEMALKAAANALPFMWTISNVISATKNAKGVNRFIAREVGSVIPTGVANIGHAVDPTVREPDYSHISTAIEQQLESRIPGLTRNVAPLTAPALPPGVRNLYHLKGPAISNPPSSLGGFNPFPVSTSKPGEKQLEKTLLERAQQRNRKRLLKALYGR